MICALRLPTPPMETPDPPSDNAGASKQVVLTPHDIPRSLRVVSIRSNFGGGGRKQKQKHTSLWSSFPVHCASVFGPVMYCLHPLNRTFSSASFWGKRSTYKFSGAFAKFFFREGN